MQPIQTFDPGSIVDQAALSAATPDAQEPYLGPIAQDELWVMRTATVDYWSNAHARYYENYGFAHGKQWDSEEEQRRKDARRDCQVYNIVQGFIRPMVNTVKQAPPAIQIYPVSQDTTKSQADTLSGVIRHIEYTSNASRSYTSALERMAEGGIGAWRVTPREVMKRTVKMVDVQVPTYDSLGRPSTRSVPQKSVEMVKDVEVAVEPICDPRAVMYDPTSTLDDFSDAKYCIYRYEMSLREYIDSYGDDVSGYGDVKNPTSTINVYEFWIKNAQGLLDLYLCTDDKVISYQETQLSIIPFVVVTGPKIILDGVMHYGCITEEIRAPQKEINWLKSEAVSTVSQAPKSSWIADEDSLINPEAWADSATNPDLALYKKAGSAVTPIPPPGPPAGYMDLASSNIEMARLVTGIYPDPTVQKNLANASGKAIKYQQAHSQTSTYQYVDSINHGVKRTGEIILDMIGIYYNTDDIRMALGIDGKYDRVSLGPTNVPNVQNIDLEFSQFGVIVSTGPSYATQREAYFDTLKDFASGNPALAPIILEAVMRNAPIPNAEHYADRAVMMLPPQIQEMIAMQQSGTDAESAVLALTIKNQKLQAQAQAQMKQLEAMASELEDSKAKFAVDIARIKAQVEISNDKNNTSMAMQAADHQHDIQVKEMELEGKAVVENIKSFNRVSESHERK